MLQVKTEFWLNFLTWKQPRLENFILSIIIHMYNCTHMYKQYAVPQHSYSIVQCILVQKVPVKKGKINGRQFSTDRANKN